MKNWNKKRSYKTWTKVTTVSVSIQKKIWCQNHKSTGKFFAQPYVNIWWFEFPEDAMTFAMEWIGK